MYIPIECYAQLKVSLSFCTYVYSFHNKLKFNPRYFDHEVNRQLDDLIHTLLKIESDTYVAHKTKEVLKAFTVTVQWILFFR